MDNPSLSEKSLALSTSSVISSPFEMVMGKEGEEKSCQIPSSSSSSSSSSMPVKKRNVDECVKSTESTESTESTKCTATTTTTEKETIEMKRFVKKIVNAAAKTVKSKKAMSKSTTTTNCTENAVGKDSQSTSKPKPTTSTTSTAVENANPKNKDKDKNKNRVSAKGGKNERKPKKQLSPSLLRPVFAPRKSNSSNRYQHVSSRYARTRQCEPVETLLPTAGRSFKDDNENNDNG